MIDAETYLSVLRSELAQLYSENLALKAELAQAGEADVLAFLSNIDGEWLEDRALKYCGLGKRTGDAFLDVLKEVAGAELRAGSS
jgi:hypothetical protein